MFAVQSVEAAKLCYEEFQRQQENLPEEKKLKIATIYSFAVNEEQRAIGEISEENFDVSAIDYTSKEFLDKVIADYNGYFKTKFSTNGNEFQNYYKDLSAKVKHKEIDLLIVVGMFLTGFDAPTLNTLFVDKNLKFHGLIQAFSRTNRILNKVKTFGNIVCFRDLEKNEMLSLGKRTKAANEFLYRLFHSPVITSAALQNEMKISAKTANSLIEAFINLNILKERTGYSRNRIFVFDKYVKLFM